MTFQSCKISKLKLLEKNPRRISKEQMQKLCKSLEDDPDFFNKRPVLVNRVDDKLQVYAGNQRVRAAKKLGWKEVPCIIDENLSDEMMKRRVVVDNKTFGEFDYDILANEYEISDLVDWGFSLDELSLDADIEEEEIKLPNDEKVLSEMSFTIANDQKELIEQALKISKNQGPLYHEINENTNGNALTRIIEFYIGKN